jgi:HAD superfamily hydrolase (TIGR01493 family)
MRAVLFDFGDTLFRRRGGPHAIIEAARALGREVGETEAAAMWSTIQARARTPEELAKGRDLSPEAHRAAWTELYSQADALAPGVGTLLYEWEVSPERWEAFPDTLPTLAALRAANVGLGVVSDTGWDIRPILDLHGWLDWFGTIVLSCEHGVAKPAPSLFLAGCNSLGVRPDETLMVGDNPLTDGGAADAGLTALILPVPRPARDGQARGLWSAARLVIGQASQQDGGGH